MKQEINNLLKLVSKRNKLNEELNLINSQIGNNLSAIVSSDLKTIDKAISTTLSFESSKTDSKEKKVIKAKPKELEPKERGMVNNIQAWKLLFEKHEVVNAIIIADYFDISISYASVILAQFRNNGYLIRLQEGFKATELLKGNYDR